MFMNTWERRVDCLPLVRLLGVFVDRWPNCLLMEMVEESAPKLTILFGSPEGQTLGCHHNLSNSLNPSSFSKGPTTARFSFSSEKSFCATL